MQTTSKSWLLPIVIAKGVLFSIAFTVAVKHLGPLLGFAPSKHTSGNLLMLGSMLTGVVCVWLYSQGVKALDAEGRTSSAMRK